MVRRIICQYLWEEEEELVREGERRGQKREEKREGERERVENNIVIKIFNYYIQKMSTQSMSDQWRKEALNTRSDWLRKQYDKEVTKSVMSENVRDKALGKLRNPNRPTGADAMKLDINAVENKRRYKRLQDLDGQLLEKLKKDSKRPAIRKYTTMALGRKLGKACKIEGKKAKIENERSCLISEINETLPDTDKGDFKRLRELADEVIEEHISQYKEVGQLMRMDVGKGKRMKEEMKVYERNIGVGEEENVGIFFKEMEKEEKCEEKLKKFKKNYDRCVYKHEKQMREAERLYKRGMDNVVGKLKKCNEELLDGKKKSIAYVERMKKKVEKLEEEKRAMEEKMIKDSERYMKEMESIKNKKLYDAMGGRRTRRKRRKKKGKKTRKIYGPKYNPKKWKPKYVMKSHNCYAYFMNNINKEAVRRCKKRDRLKPRTRKKRKEIDRCWLPQPGNISGYPPLGPKYKRNKRKLCRKVNERVLADNKEIYNTTMKKGCKKKEYMGALVVRNQGYHFYRRDKDGLWSHKHSRTKPVRIDSKGKLIKDPRKASKAYKRAPGYNTKKGFCKYYCLPMDRRKRKISLKNYGGGKSRRKRRKKTRKRKIS